MPASPGSPYTVATNRVHPRHRAQLHHSRSRNDKKSFPGPRLVPRMTAIGRTVMPRVGNVAWSSSRRRATVVRWSALYEETVTFYRDTIGLPVLETFHDSYGLDGTILGLPGGQVHLEIVRTGQASYPGGGLDQLVFYLPDAAAREQMEARLAAAGARPVPQIDYWQANGGVTYQDPDGREVVFASWIYIPPGS